MRELFWSQNRFLKYFFLNQINFLILSFYLFQDVYHLSNHVHQQNFHPSHSHQTHSSFLCERHQKRYYFSKDSVDQADFDEFLPPLPSLDYHEYPRQFPRDLTTQTVRNDNLTKQNIIISLLLILLLSLSFFLYHTIMSWIFINIMVIF